MQKLKKSHTPRAKPQNSQLGFSLLELLVSAALALFIMAGMGMMYLSISRTNAEMAKSNDIIENGRVALDVITEDLAHAGFWGGFIPAFDDMRSKVVPTDVPTASLDICKEHNADELDWSTAETNTLFGNPVQVLDAVPSTPTNCASLLVSKHNIVAGSPAVTTASDVLVVRRVANCIAGTTGCEADTAGKAYFQMSNCASEIAAGNSRVLATTGFGLRKRDCATPEAKWKYMSNMYYIRSYAVTSGDGIPTLMRSIFDTVGTKPTQMPAQALVEGIEGFRVELGVDAQSRCNSAVDYSAKVSLVDAGNGCDPNAAYPEFNTTAKNRGDGVPETYVHCAGAGGCSAAQLMNAVSAKVYVLARSREAVSGYTDGKTYQLGSAAVGPFNDGFKRHVYQMTVRLNNVAGRRETP